MIIEDYWRFEYCRTEHFREQDFFAGFPQYHVNEYGLNYWFAKKI